MIIFGVILISDTKVTVIEIKALSVDQYLDKIKPYLKDIKWSQKIGYMGNSINNSS